MPQSDTPFSYTNDHGDPLELDVLLSADVPLENFAGDDCPELAQALTAESSLDEDDLAEESSSVRITVRKTVEAYPDSIFARLVEYGLLKKVSDIVLAKVKIPWNLRDDATQAMHLKWCLIQSKPQFVRNQLAFYAYRSGQHAALALRRELGAVCVLPGTLFRDGKESAFMETIGAAVNPMDVDEYKDSLELAEDPDDMMHLATVSEGLMASRLGKLTLSTKQQQVARMVLVDRLDSREIAQRLGMRDVYVERLIKQVTLKLNNADSGVVEPERAEQPKKAAAAAKKATEKSADKAGDRAKTTITGTKLMRRRLPRLERTDRGAAA